ncbi:MAG: DUF4416 family protein [candidate division WOR-3 bacterium]
MKPARLILALLARNQDSIAKAEPLLTQGFGNILLRSETIDWNFSNYYEPEMGKNLIRVWLCFEPIVNPAQLKDFKRIAMVIEDRLRDEQGNRTINLDPGILTLHNLVLATTKDYSHRIPIDTGLYAELTLIYHQGRYQPLAWTYPDYQTQTCLNFLSACRQTLLFHSN